jgi:hypothetical protein
MVLRSRFFIGQDLPAAGFTPGQVTAEIPDVFATNLVQRGYNEMIFLAGFLPSMFRAGNRDTCPVGLP